MTKFVIDPYDEFDGVSTNDDANDYSDADKLRMLADWFDHKDDEAGVTGSEVQSDLRRIAEAIDAFQ